MNFSKNIVEERGKIGEKAPGNGTSWVRGRKRRPNTKGRPTRGKEKNLSTISFSNLMARN